MNTNTKNCIRAVVVAGIVAWPSLETYRLCVTTQRMEEAQALERSIRVRLDAARSKHVQMATVGESSANSGRDGKR